MSSGEVRPVVGPQSVAEAVGILQARYPQSLLSQAVSVFTPFSQYISLDQLDMPRQTVEFIKRYEPRAAINGLFVHQWRILEAYRLGAENFIITSATGSGKSLCFWTWVIDQLLRDPRATALVCFPTQALMWGQAERLAQISVPSSRRVYDEALGLAYSGALSFGTRSIGWTIWKGTGWGETVDIKMKKHEQTYDFLRSRIRIATLDKVHYSLIQGYPEFTKNLTCLVLDEAHQYDGIFGSNVTQLLKRLYAARESIGLPPPQVFMASATLAAARSFAAKLTSLPERAIHHEMDATSPEIEVISLPDAQKILYTGRRAPRPEGTRRGLLRVAVFNDSLAGSLDCVDFLSQERLIGSRLNVLYFSESKFRSRFLKRDIDRVVGKKRTTMIYDADLPPLRRREIEAKFNQSCIRGVTLIATNALELGVDLENLDLCVLVGSEGTGKTHLLRCLESDARALGYMTVYFSAREMARRLNDLPNFYRTIAERLDLEQILSGLCRRVAQLLGYGPERYQGTERLLPLIMEEGLSRYDAEREIRNAAGHAFRDADFGASFASFAYTVARSRMIDGNDGELQLAWKWLRGEKLERHERQQTGFFETLQKANARYWLNSLIRLLNLAGMAGLVVLIDDLEVLTERSGDNNRFLYTPGAIKDTCELFRQMIDDVELLNGFLLALAGRREIVDDEKRGFKSYEALWMRLQTGLVPGERFNPFADIVDVDAYLAVMGTDFSERLSQRLIRQFAEWGCQRRFQEIPPNLISASGLRRAVIENAYMADYPEGIDTPGRESEVAHEEV